MKISVRKLFCGMAMAFAVSAPVSAAPYQGSSFQDVWSVAQEGPYSVLPEEKVTLSSFYSGVVDKLQQSSSRTLASQEDVLPRFQKLLHRNGICLAGTWNITEETPYSGYFRKDSTGLIVMRASAALSQIHRGQKRAFGIAGKIFPTADVNDPQRYKTANFFVIDNLGGTYTPNFLDTSMTNDITAINFTLANLGQTGILAAAVKAFGLAEAPLVPLTVRQLYEISSLGESADARIVTPMFIRIQGQPGGYRSEFSDFRDDLRISANGGSYRFDISVAGNGLFGFEKKWQKIGYIEVTEDVASEGCDHQVHFHHPKWRHDLNYK